MMRQFDGKVALVTGASSGIGKATAIAFGREGAKVVVAARREAESLQTVAEIEADGGQAIFVKTDIMQPDQIEALVQTTKDEYGGLDFAFNNAGGRSPGKRLHEITEDEWTFFDDMFLKSVWRCMKAELPLMMDRGGGAIVNNASIAGIRSAAHLPYATMKHGVVGLTKSASQQYANDGIRINAIAPGWIDTDMTAGFSENEEFASALISWSHIKRPGQTKEVAGLVTWLCSESASFTTAAVIPVTGGLGA